MNSAYDVVVAGAGAAGLFCAAIAGRRGKRVLVLDHAPKAGAKILISGGGRCNFTNLSAGPANFISANPHFCKSALARFSAQDFIAMIDDAGIRYHEKHLGQLFCDGSAREILAWLLSLCEAGGVDIQLGCTIADVSRADRFYLQTSAGTFEAPALVLATGGLSIPKMGATGFAYDIARQFGLGVVAPRPGLVPLVFGGEESAWMRDLTGISFDSICGFGKRQFREQALFTHRGLSGPAVLQISSYLPAGEAMVLDMLPDQNIYDALLARRSSRPKAEIKTILGEFLPARLAQSLLRPPLSGGRIGQMGNRALETVAATIHRLALTPTGTEGFAKAEVTVGGVDTGRLSSRSMAARDVPGLFVIGEAVDVTGWLGGFNFQWAWSSAYCAGQAV